MLCLLGPSCAWLASLTGERWKAHMRLTEGWCIQMRKAKLGCGLLWLRMKDAALGKLQQMALADEERESSLD